MTHLSLMVNIPTMLKRIPPVEEKLWIILSTYRWTNGPTDKGKAVYPPQLRWWGVKLDMLTARRRLKSPRSLSGTSTHPTMVTLVNIMVMNGWPRSFSFHVNRPPHSWDKAISDSDLETPRSRSWVWSKGKVIQWVQYHLLFISHQSDQQFRR